jgi:hypothetical protein
VNRPGSEWVERSYKSLERPAEYFGCHINIGIASIMTIMLSALSFAFAGFVNGLMIFLAGIFLAGIMVKIGRKLSREDPYWPDAFVRHLMDEDDYLDV